VTEDTLYEQAAEANGSLLDQLARAYPRERKTPQFRAGI